MKYTKWTSYWGVNDSELPAGWYAILYCWDVEEGSFPGADFWQGIDWEEGYPITHFAGPFNSEYEAEGWAEVNDPDAPDNLRQRGLL